MEEKRRGSRQMKYICEYWTQQKIRGNHFQELVKTHLMNVLDFPWGAELHCRWRYPGTKKPQAQMDHSTLIKKLHILNQTPNYRRSDAEKDAIDHLMKKLHQMKSRQNHSLQNLSALNYLKRKVNTGSKDKTTAATRSNKKNCRVCRDHFKEPQEPWISHLDKISLYLLNRNMTMGADMRPP
jgi:hypothetical protein